jgi:hypothetical protein
MVLELVFATFAASVRAGGAWVGTGQALAFDGGTYVVDFFKAVPSAAQRAVPKAFGGGVAARRAFVLVRGFCHRASIRQAFVRWGMRTPLETLLEWRFCDKSLRAGHCCTARVARIGRT